MQLFRAFPFKAGNSSTGGGNAGSGVGAGDFPVTASPASINKYSPVPGATVTSAAVTATAAAPGVAPFTHAWTCTNSHITVTSPSAATTTFGYTGSGASSDDAGIATDTVTDTNGLVGSVSIVVEFQVGGARDTGQ